MRVYIPALIFIVVVTISLDVTVWRLCKNFRLSLSKYLKTGGSIIFWTIPAFFILLYIYMPFVIDNDNMDEVYYYYFTFLNGLYLLFYTPKILGIIFYLTSHLILKISDIRNRQTTLTKSETKQKRITRAQFLGRLSLMVAAIPFTSIIYNISNGRFKFAVNKNQVPINNLPEGLEGLRIIQLSDIHLGNFNSEFNIIDKIVEHINSLNPDLIFITGDLVNNFASETKGWEKSFQKLTAKHGKFAVLGNHDYGDYCEWKSTEAREFNFNGIKQAFSNFGFKLLLNSNEKLKIKNSELSIIGVENWGHPPFPRYGNLKTAMTGDLAATKILLTHDPDHWEAEILDYTNIDLCLSGHTHGMQLGIKFRNKEWSPAKWKYKYWGGLYKNKEQHLYVNRGLGYVGIPLRVGMPPEVTLLTLASKS